MLTPPSAYAVDWVVGGNDITSASSEFLGTKSTSTDKDMELHSGSVRVLKFDYNATSTSIIGGYSGNTATTSVGVTIGGGGASGSINQTTSDCDYCTIGGGVGNYIDHDWSTIGGGELHSIEADRATISGGSGNTIDGNNRGTIGGGFSNVINGATGSSTIAGGDRNKTYASGYCSIGGGQLNVIGVNDGSGIVE
ncbi:MAG: hypothetical protein HUU55_18945 [Myxococcales bacterium]|nr:hypothetical protein [Myxococcales bacterium]